jgi:hypothetical protein
MAMVKNMEPERELTIKIVNHGDIDIGTACRVLIVEYEVGKYQILDTYEPETSNHSIMTAFTSALKGMMKVW